MPLGYLSSNRHSFPPRLHFSLLEYKNLSGRSRLFAISLKVKRGVKVKIKQARTVSNVFYWAQRLAFQCTAELYTPNEWNWFDPLFPMATRIELRVCSRSHVGAQILVTIPSISCKSYSWWRTSSQLGYGLDICFWRSFCRVKYEIVHITSSPYLNLYFKFSFHNSVVGILRPLLDRNFNWSVQLITYIKINYWSTNISKVQ